MSLADALNGIKETRMEPASKPTAKPLKRPTQVRTRVEVAPVRQVTLQRATGKSANPNYEKFGTYVRKDLRRKAERQFEDEGGEGFADLIEKLLLGYVGEKASSRIVD